MKKIGVILIAFILLGGCEKAEEPPPPIVEPGSYFPVYPGSWWKYVDMDNYISMSSTSDDYLVHSYKTGDEPEKYSEPKRVPFLDGQPIYGYCYVEEVGWPTTIHRDIHELWPILFEKVGHSFWAYFTDLRYAQPCENVTVVSKTFNGKDSVLLLESGMRTLYSGESYIFPWIRYRRYTKGIGLTSDISIDSETSDTISKTILIDYFVNHSFPASLK